jgi:ABC-type spermidine/putrescine transport system permease subunit I
MFFAIITMVLGFLLAVGVSGGKALLYVDVPTLILTILLPVLFLNILYGMAFVRKVFKAPFQKDAPRELLVQACSFFKTFNKTVWLAALVSVLTGLIATLAYTDNRADLSANLALILLTPLYAGLISIIILLPYGILIRKRLNNADEIGSDNRI